MALVLGAVAYDAKVVDIWEGFRDWFIRAGLDFDYILYSNYERQVEALLRGEVDVAWNSPLAWLQTERGARKDQVPRALAMRDTDRDLRSVILVRAGGPTAMEELRGGTVAVGAADSPQATLIPLEHLAASGLIEGRDLRVLRHEVMVGKHGDHIGGEREAVQALLRGEADAACIIDGNFLGFARDGTLPPGAVQVLSATAPYDHCNMSAVRDHPALVRFVALLLEMSWEDAETRRLMELEGLRRWLPGRTSGYAQLNAAVDRLGTLVPWLESLG